jgi:hypothetical protein
VAIESAKGGSEDRFGHLIHVSYNGRLWGCAAEQLQPWYPTAKAVCEALEDSETLKNCITGNQEVKGFDIKLEAPLPGEIFEGPPQAEDIPPESLPEPGELTLEQSQNRRSQSKTWRRRCQNHQWNKERNDK